MYRCKTVQFIIRTDFSSNEKKGRKECEWYESLLHPSLLLFPQNYPGSSTQPKTLIIFILFEVMLEAHAVFSLRGEGGGCLNMYYTSAAKLLHDMFAVVMVFASPMQWILQGAKNP